ncbi:MAG: hypothetical protein ACSHXH_19035 [Marivita sp.]|uniref:hypothetical protein n=1 Tax=Marivita sp. TaxID=2003365 RepID=UPI003EF3A3C8
MPRPAIALACALSALAFAIASPVLAQDQEPEGQATEAQPASDFVGRYNGNSFETAMGMIVREDGTFEWGLSVGGLDMRAAGTWTQQGEFILFTSDPVPVAPEFGWLGNESVPDRPLVKVVQSTNGEPFQYADALLTCANGARFNQPIPSEGWSPPEGECDTPESLQLIQSNYDVRSPVYDLAGTFAVQPGETIRFEFRRNDLGVADFTGMSGVLVDGVLSMNGGQWPLEMRKVERE